MRTGRAVRELRQQWQPLDPARDGVLPSVAVREATLEQVLASSLFDDSNIVIPQHRGARLRRTLFAAAGAVTAGGVLVIANPAQGPSFAATPRPIVADSAVGVPAAAELRRLATVAEHSTASFRDDGVDHLRYDSWSMYSGATASKDDPNSVIMPSTNELWRRADDSGRTVIQNGTPLIDGVSLRQRISIWWRFRDDKPRDETYAAGKFPASWKGGRPPVDTAALASWLNRGVPPEATPDAVMVLSNNLLRERALTPTERTALLRVLARTPGLEFVGVATDRAGRHGEAFQMTGRYSSFNQKYTMLVEPESGRVLATERELLEPLEGLDVKPPAVIDYQTYLTAE